MEKHYEVAKDFSNKHIEIIDDDILKGFNEEKLEDKIEHLSELRLANMWAGVEIDSEELEEEYEYDSDWNTVHSYYFVSSFAYKLLKEANEIVFRYGRYRIWGRRAYGQEPYLDPIIIDIANINSI